MFEIFEHTADLGLRVRAPTLQQLFVDAATGLFSIVVVNLDEVQVVTEREIAIESEPLDYLLFDWLTELLYLFETEHLVLRNFELSINPPIVHALGRGETIDPIRHQLDHEIKAITYHGLSVAQHDELWIAEVIVDI